MIMLERTQPLRVAIIGAGLAGLSAARTLRDRGHEVRVFDKGLSVGGRTSRPPSFILHPHNVRSLICSFRQTSFTGTPPSASPSPKTISSSVNRFRIIPLGLQTPPDIYPIPPHSARIRILLYAHSVRLPSHPVP
jgi:cation diffusion facilitator CzcD-associated flavoprotein CzcO